MAENAGVRVVCARDVTQGAELGQERLKLLESNLEFGHTDSVLGDSDGGKTGGFCQSTGRGTVQRSTFSVRAPRNPDAMLLPITTTEPQTVQPRQ